MGSHSFGIRTLLFICLIVIPPWYGKGKVNSKSLDNINTDYENGMEAKFDGQNNKETEKKNRKMTQKNKDKKASQKGKNKGKTIKNGKTKKNRKIKKKGEGSKSKKNGKQKNKAEVKNPETSSTNPAGDLEEFLIEGDMILDRFQYEQLKKGLINGELDGVKAKQNNINIQDNHRNAIIDKKYHWNNRIVYYSFHSSISLTQKNLVRTTLAKLQKKISGCLKFEEHNYVVDRIQVTTTKSTYCSNGGCCRSSVGYQHKNKIQILELSKNGCWNRGTIEHEFLHAIGIRHAQSRSDRKKYVRVIKGNIETNKLSNFNIYSASVISHHSLPYDYYSVMHYGKHSFSKNGRITIKTMDPSKENAIGQRDEGVTIGDIQLIQHMYGCSIEVTYGRCYEIANGRDEPLPYKILADNKNSAKKCKAHCYKKGFDYAGVSTKWCYCGNYIPSNSLKKPSTDCSTSCPADITQFCGANRRYNVFRTNTAFVDGTCYEHRNVIYSYRFQSDTMTPDKCKRHCANAGYAFAGVQYYDKCFCGHNRLPYNKIKDSSECDKNCKGDSSKKCGGSYKMSVYGTESHSYLSYLSSPNYPNNYPNNKDVYQHLSAPVGHFIKINFLNFKIQDNSRCNYDYVQFYDGFGKKHGKFCGDTKPSNFIIPSQSAKIHFHSDSSQTRQGYLLSYQRVKLPGDHQETPYFDLDGGYWGDWGYYQKCRYPHFVKAMELKIQEIQSWNKDNTALNAIRLTCSNGETITSVQGGEGSWSRVHSCPSETFMHGAAIRRENYQDWIMDNTEANGVKFSCTDTDHSTPHPIINPGDGHWGSWSSFYNCGKGNAVIGLATRVDRDPGSYVYDDKTGLNDVRFYCAKLPHIQIIYPGTNSVRSQNRINLEETKEKKVPGMNTTQITVNDRKIGRIANQINEDNTETGRNSKQTRVVNTEKDKNTNQTTQDNTKTLIEYADHDQ